MWEPQPVTTLRASTACTGVALAALYVYCAIQILIQTYTTNSDLEVGELNYYVCQGVENL
jgi:hypothetical protein